MSLVDSLKKIHKEVFDRFEYITDLEQYKAMEFWESVPEDFELPDTIRSDCEGFSIYCRKLCMQQNIQTRLVVCYDEIGSGHCVLECEGYVLDNRHSKLMTKKQLEKIGYKWIAISGPFPGDKWHRLDR